MLPLPLQNALKSRDWLGDRAVGVERSSDTMRKCLRAAGCSSSPHALALSALPLGRQVDDSAGEKE